MNLVKNSRRDPYFNIALEEYLLKQIRDDSVMLWCSKPSIILGKHQNALAEINFPYVYARNIPVVRRLTGGGTVFHGPGNLNFTFIQQGETGKMIDFRKYTAPVIDFLNTLGVPAKFEGKNDIRVNGRKISGNAEHVFKDRVLHHGTLLYQADLGLLEEAIRIEPDRYKDRGVQSVRGKVANIADFIKDPPPFDQFMQMLNAYLKTYFGIVNEYVVGSKDIHAVYSLVANKYNRWEWNYGYSPAYAFIGRTFFQKGDIGLELKVKNGVIMSAAFSGSGLSPSWQLIEKELPGKRHEVSEISHLLRHYRIISPRMRKVPAALLKLFF